MRDTVCVILKWLAIQTSISTWLPLIDALNLVVVVNVAHTILGVGCCFGGERERERERERESAGVSVYDLSRGGNSVVPIWPLNLSLSRSRMVSMNGQGSNPSCSEMPEKQLFG